MTHNSDLPHHYNRRKQDMLPLSIRVGDDSCQPSPSIMNAHTPPRGPGDSGEDNQFFAVLTVKENGNPTDQRRSLEIRALPEVTPGPLVPNRETNNNSSAESESKRPMRTEPHQRTCAVSVSSPISDLDVEEVFAALTAAVALASPLSSARTSASDLSSIEPLVEPLVNSQDVCYSTPHPSFRLPTTKDLLSPPNADSKATDGSRWQGHVGLVRTTKGIFELHCARSGCHNRTTLDLGRRQYKSCHSCHTYYCCRQCRARAWPDHKIRCPFSLAGTACKRAIRYIFGHVNALYHLSRVARTGYLALGRGCLVLLFKSPTEAQSFVEADTVSKRPVYISMRDLEATGLAAEQCLDSVVSAVRYYDPEVQFVLNVAVAVMSLAEAVAKSRRNTRMIKKCGTLNLSNAQLRPIERRNGGPVPMILTNQVDVDITKPEEARRQRQVFFMTVQRRLRERGVDLRADHPFIYNKLVSYVESGQRFPAQTIYPVDRVANQRFMCMIMPGSDPLMQWVSDPATIKELDLSLEVRRRFSLLETDL